MTAKAYLTLLVEFIPCLFASISLSILCSSFKLFKNGRSPWSKYLEYSIFSSLLIVRSTFSRFCSSSNTIKFWETSSIYFDLCQHLQDARENEKLTFTGASKRKHALQLQFPRHTGQASAMSSSGVCGYLHDKMLQTNYENCNRPDIRIVIIQCYAIFF